MAANTNALRRSATPAPLGSAEAICTPCPAAQAPQVAPLATQAAENTPTTEQLSLAFRELWRQGWPSTLEAALQQHHLRICITGLARQRQRKPLQAWRPHSLPRLPAPPTPAGIGKPANGRSEYSLATGPKTDLGSWRGSSPKSMMPGAPNIKRTYFDVRRAAANDLDD